MEWFLFAFKYLNKIIISGELDFKTSFHNFIIKGDRPAVKLNWYCFFFFSDYLQFFIKCIVN